MDTGPLYLTVTHPLARVKGDDISPIALRYRLPFADGGDWCYAKVSLTDSEKRRWSAYVATKPTASWQRLALERKDFRRDDGDKGSAGLPQDAALTAFSMVVRKGKTKAPVAAVLEIDDVALGGR